jgi:hypothetical protein
VRPYCRTKISSQHMITIPMTPFGEAELAVGDRLILEADGPGVVIARRVES